MLVPALSGSRSAWLFAAACAVTVTACGGEGGASGPSADAPPPPPPPEPYPRPAYALVSETGIYSDASAHTLAKGFEAFEPAFALWADGAEKRRFIALPAGTTIDTSDLDHWRFPVGTRLVKEFWLDGALLETRLIERYGKGKDDYFVGAFVWHGADDADFAPDGENDVAGTAHDVPSQKQCWSCHNGDAGHVLGFSALELGRADDASSGLTLKKLAAEQRLSDPPAELPAPPPGDAVTSRALGYLHANCGHCHNLHGTAWPDTQMVLRLNVGASVAEETELYQSVVGQAAQYFRDANAAYRVVPGDPDTSALVVRMRARGDDDQMPPLGTEQPDDDGILAVSAWIRALPPADLP